MAFIDGIYHHYIMEPWLIDLKMFKLKFLDEQTEVRTARIITNSKDLSTFLKYKWIYLLLTWPWSKGGMLWNALAQTMPIQLLLKDTRISDRKFHSWAGILWQGILLLRVFEPFFSCPLRTS